MIHSQNSNQVNSTLARYFEQTARDQDQVLLITHAALLNMPHRLVIPRRHRPPDQVVFDRAEWDLTIDEAPDTPT